jgi:hypothetical protein
VRIDQRRLPKSNNQSGSQRLMILFLEYFVPTKELYNDFRAPRRKSENRTRPKLSFQFIRHLPLANVENRYEALEQ